MSEETPDEVAQLRDLLQQREADLAAMHDAQMRAERALQDQLAAQMQRVPGHMRPLLGRLPVSEALDYIRQHGEQWQSRPAPQMDAGQAGERTAGLDLSPGQARLVMLARRCGYALDARRVNERKT